MENEYGEIGKEDVENRDFYTIVKIPSLRHKGFWTTPILLSRQSRHDAVERTPSKNWALERISEALRCFHRSPLKEGVTFRNSKKMCSDQIFESWPYTSGQKRAPLSLVLVFRPFFEEIFSSPSLRLIVRAMKHKLLLNMMTLLPRVRSFRLYSPCNTEQIFSAVSILTSSL